MTECKVICRDCHTDHDGPRTWLWLCELCAEECLDRHRAETGHTSLELQIAQSFTELGDRIRERRHQLSRWTR